MIISIYAVNNNSRICTFPSHSAVSNSFHALPCSPSRTFSYTSTHPSHHYHYNHYIYTLDGAQMKVCVSGTCGDLLLSASSSSFGYQGRCHLKYVFAPTANKMTASTMTRISSRQHCRDRDRLWYRAARFSSLAALRVSPAMEYMLDSMLSVLVLLGEMFGAVEAALNEVEQTLVDKTSHDMIG